MHKMSTLTLGAMMLLPYPSQCHVHPMSFLIASMHKKLVSLFLNARLHKESALAAGHILLLPYLSRCHVHRMLQFAKGFAHHDDGPTSPFASMYVKSLSGALLVPTAQWVRLDRGGCYAMIDQHYSLE